MARVLITHKMTAEPEPGERYLTVAELDQVKATLEAAAGTADAVLVARIGWRGRVRSLSAETLAGEELAPLPALPPGLEADDPDWPGWSATSDFPRLPGSDPYAPELTQPAMPALPAAPGGRHAR